MSRLIKISIIIPIYNPGKLIKRCIDSITEQTYKNFELILVDDGSTDNSSEIYKEYVNSNIYYHKIKNGGANNARNVGFKYSTGDIIHFMDQDDYYYSENSLQYIAEIFQSSSSIDLLIFRYTEYFQVSKKYKERPKYNSTIVEEINVSHLVNEFVKSGNVPISPWDKVFRRKFLEDNNIEFPVGLTAGDINWFIEICEKAQKIKVTNELIYVYVRQVTGSLTNIFSVNKFVDLLNIIEIEVNRIIDIKDYKFRNQFLSFLAYEFIILIAMMPNLNKVQKHNFATRINNLKWLLEFDLNKKVKASNKLFRVFGLRVGSLLLNQYINKRVNN